MTRVAVARGSYLTPEAVAAASELGLACVLVANLVDIIKLAVALAAATARGELCGAAHEAAAEQGHYNITCENCL